MGFFGQSNLYTKKQMKYGRVENNAAMKNIMEKEGVSGILDKKSEKTEFFNAIKKEAGSGGLSKDGLKRVLGDLRRGKGKTIDKGEAMKLAKAFFPNRGFGNSPYASRKETKPQSTVLVDRVSQIRLEAAQRRKSSTIASNNLNLPANNKIQLANNRFSGIASSARPSVNLK